MKPRKIVLINSNRMKPPIGPLALDYLAPSLRQRGFEPTLIDLSFEPDWLGKLDEGLKDGALAVGVTVRNIDDSYMSSSEFFLPQVREIVSQVRERTSGPVILGGVGYSIVAGAALEFCGAEFGISGDGEQSLPQLLQCILEGLEPSDVPGIVAKTEKGFSSTAPEYPALTSEPFPDRDFIDNLRYFTEGGQAGIETKRGCPGQCIYCADPLSKGRTVRLRPPATIAREIRNLLKQGIDCFHICDSEFNIPLQHAKDICRGIVDDGLSDSITWYCYMAPAPLDEELIRLMKAGGCIGINFGADHSVSFMLNKLGRQYDSGHLAQAAALCKDYEITVMFDMLFGAPGETEESIREAIGFMKSIGPDCVGVSAGVRVYPNTPLARTIEESGRDGLHFTGGKDKLNYLKPAYFVNGEIGENIHDIIVDAVGDDPRFFVGSKEPVDSNYNYNDNTVLAESIRQGARGAYWDILRKLKLEE